MLLKSKQMLKKWHIFQNNHEKHGLTVNVYQNELMVGPSSIKYGILCISDLKVFVLFLKGNYRCSNENKTKQK